MKGADWNWFQLAAMQYIHKINKRGDAFEVIAGRRGVSIPALFAAKLSKHLR